MCSFDFILNKLFITYQVKNKPMKKKQTKSKKVRNYIGIIIEGCQIMNNLCSIWIHCYNLYN